MSEVRSVEKVKRKRRALEDRAWQWVPMHLCEAGVASDAVKGYMAGYRAAQRYLRRTAKR